MNRVFKSHCWRSCFPVWQDHLASLSLQIASADSEHQGKNNEGPNQWMKSISLPRGSRIIGVRLIDS